MPCHYDPTPEELAASAAARDERTAAPYKEAADRLTRENDQLRELLLRLIDEHHITLDADGTAERVLREAQKRHRQADLDRLEEFFTNYLADSTNNNRYAKQQAATYLSKVLGADPSRALEPQLGFDPDSY